jgi:hypothetical protein
MTTQADNPSDRSLRAYARFAGFMYLFTNAAYVASLNIVSGIVVDGNFAATARNIAASEQFYRIGLSIVLTANMTTIILGWALYALLKPVGNKLALLGLVCRVAEAALFGVFTALNFAAIVIYTGTASGFELATRQEMAHLLSYAQSVGFNISAIYFSPASIIFFYLLFKSRFIPRGLSLLGIVGSICVMVVCYGTLIVPHYWRELQFGWAPIGAAELLVGLWLLLAGANLEYWNGRVKDPHS